MNTNPNLVAREGQDAAAVRVNRLGDVCPAWCTVDHGKLLVADPAVYADVHSSDVMSARDPSGPSVYVTMDDLSHAVRVVITEPGGRVAVPPEQAEKLAGLIKALANYTPERLQDLADEVRVAASVLPKAGGVR